MQEADHKTTYDKTITTPNARYALIDAFKRTQHEIQRGEDHTIPRGRENNDYMRGRGEQLERHKRSPIGTLKERNMQLRSLEHDTILPHSYNLLHFQNTFTSTSTTDRHDKTYKRRSGDHHRDTACRHELDGMFRRRVLYAP